MSRVPTAVPFDTVRLFWTQEMISPVAFELKFLSGVSLSSQSQLQAPGSRSSKQQCPSSPMISRMFWRQCCVYLLHNAEQANKVTFLSMHLSLESSQKSHTVLIPVLPPIATTVTTKANYVTLSKSELSQYFTHWADMHSQRPGQRQKFNAIWVCTRTSKGSLCKQSRLLICCSPPKRILSLDV